MILGGSQYKQIEMGCSEVLSEKLTREERLNKGRKRKRIFRPNLVFATVNRKIEHGCITVIFRFYGGFLIENIQFPTNMVDLVKCPPYLEHNVQYFAIIVSDLHNSSARGRVSFPYFRQRRLAEVTWSRS